MQPSKSWAEEKRAADVFMPSVKRIMGHVILVEPTLFEDQTQNTDLKVLVVRGTRIAVRIRRAAEHARFGHQFTLRLARPSGIKTELEKIAEGWGDWFFYGFGDFETGKLVAYTVIDLAAFRRRLIVNHPPIRFEDQTNRDGSSSFRAYDLASFDDMVIVRRASREAA